MTASPRVIATLVTLTLLPGGWPAAFAEAAPQGQQTVTRPELADAELEARVREIASTLRCPTCRALSVQDSPSGMAEEMRGLIREQLRAGRTPDEVKAYFVERYGEWILLKPKAEGFNWTVWLLPVFVLAGGLIFVVLTARRWVQQGQARAAALTERGQEEDI